VLQMIHTEPLSAEIMKSINVLAKILRDILKLTFCFKHLGNH